MKRFLALVGLGLALTASSALAATIVTYTDSGTFNSSSIVGGSTTVTENFNTNASLFTTFNVAGTVGGTPGFTGGVRSTRVNSGIGAYSEVITLNGGGDMTAWGATFDLAPGSGLGSGIKLLITFADTTTQVVTLSSGIYIGQAAILGYNVGNSGSFFFGFTSSTGFTSLTLLSADAGGQTAETFNIDDMLVESGSLPPPPPPSGEVPEPSTLGLMGAAMVGLGLFRRFRK